MQQWLLPKSYLIYFGVLHKSAKPAISKSWQHGKAEEHHPLLQQPSTYFNLGRLYIVCVHKIPCLSLSPQHSIP